VKAAAPGARSAAHAWSNAIGINSETGSLRSRAPARAAARRSLEYSWALRVTGVHGASVCGWLLADTGQA